MVNCRINYGIDVASSNGEALLFWFNSMAARGRVSKDTIDTVIGVAEKVDAGLDASALALKESRTLDADNWLVSVNKLLLELESRKKEVSNGQ